MLLWRILSGSARSSDPTRNGGTVPLLVRTQLGHGEPRAAGRRLNSPLRGRSVFWLGFRPRLALHVRHELREVRPAVERVEVRLLQFAGIWPSGLDGIRGGGAGLVGERPGLLLRHPGFASPRSPAKSPSTRAWSNRGRGSEFSSLAQSSPARGHPRDRHSRACPRILSSPRLNLARRSTVRAQAVFNGRRHHTRRHLTFIGTSVLLVLSCALLVLAAPEARRRLECQPHRANGSGGKSRSSIRVRKSVRLRSGSRSWSLSIEDQ